MPPFESMDRHQKAVYWEKTRDDNYGNPVVTHPIELDVRWEPALTQIKDNQGNVITINGVIFSDRELVIGSVFWKGTIFDLPTDSSDPTDLHRIVNRFETPSLCGRYTQWSYGVSRYKESLPTVE